MRNTAVCMAWRRLWRGAFWVLAMLIVAAQVSAAAERPPAAAIASAHPLATEAGQRILAAGGNAFDAAVAVSAALAVMEPYSSGLGGGGFWLLHRAQDGQAVMIDGREKAPLAAHRDMYLDAQGEVTPGLSVDGPLAAGIPGTPAALVHLAKTYGRLALAQTLAPAIRLAQAGFAADKIYRRLAELRLPALLASAAAAGIFLVDGQAPAEGAVIRQPELAATLRLIARHGRAGFYEGRLAGQLVGGVRAAGGVWQLDDLRQYQVVERRPVTGEYRGVTITAAAPPSSGGVVLVEMLNMLSGYSLAELDKLKRTHVMVEAMRRAYRDRADYLGDPDFIDMPLDSLLSPHYAAGLRAGIRLDRATPSAALPGIEQTEPVGFHTSHFSVLDRDGNRVAATLSINYPFGSGFVPPGTGVLLNDEMDDFVAKPGTPNVYALVGADANAIAPAKRMLSSMTPTFVDDGQRVALLGTPGGSRIITMLLLATLEFARGGDAQAIVTLPRFHHQYLPDVVHAEPAALSEEMVRALEDLGHQIERLEGEYGNMQAVVWDRAQGEVSAASDPRGIGKAIVR